MNNSMNNSFDSTAALEPVKRKLVKSKATAVVAINQRPFKQHKLKLELDKEENEAYGTISFEVTPVQTPCACRCPDAPKPVKAKLLLRIHNIRRLAFSSDEEDECL